MFCGVLYEGVVWLRVVSCNFLSERRRRVSC